MAAKWVKILYISDELCGTCALQAEELGYKATQYPQNKVMFRQIYQDDLSDSLYQNLDLEDVPAMVILNSENDLIDTFQPADHIGAGALEDILSKKYGIYPNTSEPPDAYVEVIKQVKKSVPVWVWYALGFASLMSGIIFYLKFFKK